MNNRTKPADNPALSANTVDFQDVYCIGMDQAIGFEKKKSSWFAPVGQLFKAAAQAIGFCVEMRRSWLSLLAPQATSRVSTVASKSSTQSQPSPEELAYSMDVVIGVQYVAAPRSMAPSSSVRIALPQTTPDELAYSMDIAIGEPFTVSSGAAVISSDGQSPSAEVIVPSKGLAMAARAGG